MANIRGLGDYNGGGGGGNNNNRPQFQGQPGQLPNFMNAFVSNRSEPVDPRKEGFFKMLATNFTPQMTWKYFIAWISAAQIATFLICDIGSLVSGKGLSNLYFLGANQEVFRLWDKDA